MLDLWRWREWRRWVPADCPGCRKRTGSLGLCDDCRSQLDMETAGERCPACAHRLLRGLCPDCGIRTPAYDRVLAAFDYRGLGQRLVRDYKVACQLSLAGVLALELESAVRRTPDLAPPLSSPNRLVVPVPAHKDSLRRRGFSPPAEVARLLARRLRLPYRLDGVRRRRDGPRQTMLSRVERERAPLDAFVCDQDLSGRVVVVVDDVLTTGATLHAVAIALKAAGAVSVEGWVLARAGRG